MGRRGLVRPAEPEAVGAPLLTPLPIAAVPASFSAALGFGGPEDSIVGSKKPAESVGVPEEDEAPTNALEHTFRFIVHCFLFPVLLSNANHWIFSKHLGWNDWDTLFTLRPGFWKECAAWFFTSAIAAWFMPSLKRYALKQMRRLYSWRFFVAYIVLGLTYFVCVTHALAIGKKFYHLGLTYYRTGEWLASRRVFSHHFHSIYMDWATNEAWDDQALELALHKSVGLQPDFANFMYGLYLFAIVHAAMLFLYFTVPHFYKTWYKGFRAIVVKWWRKRQGPKTK